MNAYTHTIYLFVSIRQACRTMCGNVITVYKHPGNYRELRFYKDPITCQCVKRKLSQSFSLSGSRLLEMDVWSYLPWYFLTYQNIALTRREPIKKRADLIATHTETNRFHFVYRYRQRSVFCLCKKKKKKKKKKRRKPNKKPECNISNPFLLYS